MTKIEEIYEYVLPEMEAHDIEDTPENRYAFLLGLQAAWREDESFSIEKLAYQIELIIEIMRLSRLI